MLQKMLKVGELAEQSGITVRTLHHYDRLGLVKPSHRSRGGYRLYDGNDIARLQMVRSLQGLGLPLQKIKAMLERKDISMQQVLRMHFVKLKQRVIAEQELVSRLEGMGRALSGKRDVPFNQVIDLLKFMSNMEKCYSPGAQEAIKRQGEKLGPEKIKAVEAEWPKLIAEVRGYMERGTDPQDPAVQKLAGRWMELVAMFTAGNPEVEKGLSQLYQHEGPALQQRFGSGVPDADLFSYVQKALGK